MTFITVSSGSGGGVDFVDGTKTGVVVKYLTYCGFRRCQDVSKGREEENHIKVTLSCGLISFMTSETII